MLVGVGPELEWLVGYPAVGHERLNLLVVPPAGPLTFVGPRLEAAAAEQAPGLAAGSVRLVTWEERDDPYLLVPPLLSEPMLVAALASEAAAGPEAAAGRILVSDGLRAAFLLGLQGVLAVRRWGLASALLAPLRRSKDADELALMRAAAEAADRVIEAIAAGPADRSHGGRGGQGGARAARGRGPRYRGVRHRGLRAEQRLAAPRTGRAGHPRR